MKIEQLVDWDQVSENADVTRRPLESQTELITRLANVLPTSDRLLVQAALKYGQPIGTISQLAGRTRQQTYRRLRRLISRVLSDSFRQACVYWGWLSPAERRLVELSLFRGQCMRAMAEQMNCSRRQVDRRLKALQARLASFRDERNWPGHMKRCRRPVHPLI